jgi:hypothetical protein
MTDQRFNKGIRDLKKISMTAEEKQAILARIVGEPQTRATFTRPVKSPWTVFSFGSWVSSHRSLTAVCAVLLLIIIGGGGVVSASGNALPGDLFYTFKVNVSEPLRVAMANSPVAKARIQSELADKRLAEAETLAIDGKLGQAQAKEITTLLNEHTADLATTLKEVKQATPSQAEDVSVGFQASMDAHAQVLDSISADSSDKSIATLARANAEDIARNNIPKDAEPTVPAISPAISASSKTLAKNMPTASAPGIAPQAMTRSMSLPEGYVGAPLSSATAPAPDASTAPDTSDSTGTAPASTGTAPAGYSATNAGTVSSTPSAPVTTPSDNSSSNTPEIQNSTSTDATSSPEITIEAYTAKRAVVVGIIENASSTLASVASSSNKVSASLSVQAKATLSQARQALNNADKQKSLGNIRAAYSILLHAEKSAREAVIILKAREHWKTTI